MRDFLKVTIVMLFSLAPFAAKGQIDYQGSFNYSGNYAKLEKEGYKFYLMDVAAEQCRIYNSDLNLWKTVQLSIPNNRWLSDIQFLSQNLFDNDDGIEFLYVYYQYVQTSTSYYYVYTTCVADENGSILLEVPGGSWSEIKNMDNDGARLMIYVYDYSAFPYSVQTRIYRLPGQLTGIPENEVKSWFQEGETAVYPNPSNGSFNFRVPGMPQAEKTWAAVLDGSGKVILRQPVNQGDESVDLRSLGFPAGTYYLRLESSKLQTKFQKIVLVE